MCTSLLLSRILQALLMSEVKSVALQALIPHHSLSVSGSCEGHHTLPFPLPKVRQACTWHHEKQTVQGRLKIWRRHYALFIIAGWRGNIWANGGIEDEVAHLNLGLSAYFACHPAPPATEVLGGRGTPLPGHSCYSMSRRSFVPDIMHCHLPSAGTNQLCN